MPATEGKKVKASLFTLNFALIWLATLHLMLVFYSFNTTLPMYIETFGSSVKYAGLAITSLTVAAIASRLAAGYLLDKFGRKIIFLIGILLFLIPTVTYISMLPVIALIVLRFVQGLGWGIGHTAANTVAMDIVPHKRLGEGLGMFAISSSASMAIAPAIALWIIYRFSFRHLFIACSFLIVIAAILALCIKYPHIELPPTAFSLKGFIEKKALRPSVTGFIIIFANSAVMTFLPLFAGEIELEQAGLFFTATAVTTFLSRPFAGLIIDRLGLKGYNFNVVLSVALLVLTVLILSSTTLLLHLLAAGVLYGVGTGFAQSTLLALCAKDAAANEKGRAVATYWAFVDLGASTGSLFWGFVAAAYGYRLMFLFAGIPLLIALVVYFVWRSGSRQLAGVGESPVVESI